MGKQHCQWCKWLLTFISEFMFLKLWTVDWPSTTLVCKELIWWYSLSEQIGVWLLSLHLFLHNMWNICASWQWWRWDIPSFNFSPLTPSPTCHCIGRQIPTQRGWVESYAAGVLAGVNGWLSFPSTFFILLSSSVTILRNKQTSTENLSGKKCHASCYNSCEKCDLSNR